MEFGKFFKPMLLTEKELPFNSNEFLFELKFDGTRAVIHSGPKMFRIFSRRGQEITNLYPELTTIQELTQEDTILDGEIVLFTDGVPNFSKLQERSHLKDKNRIAYWKEHYPVCFIAFDCLYKKKEIANRTLIERKKVLEEIQENDQLIKVDFVLEKGKNLFQKVQKKQLEGIVAKKITSTYQINTRSKDWIKIKNLKQEVFFIGGYLNKEENAMITLYLGEYQNKSFSFVGKVMLSKKSSLYKKIVEQKIRNTSPFSNKKEIEGNYLKPELTCTVIYLERTKKNHLRQAIIKE